jgi:ubiquinone/menaquinone biosynthesis C-methylase UbiE
MMSQVREGTLVASEQSAHDEQGVASLYQSAEVVATYIQRRFSHSWGRLLHQKQVAEVNRVLTVYQPLSILEIAPGPARIAAELQGVRQGVLLEHSKEMLAYAKRRLAAAGCEAVWELRHGNAFELEKLQRQFDFLYTFRFIRHFKGEERVRLYHNITACLRSQGLFMLDVVNQTVRQKLDARQPQKLSGELDIYDATYTAESFRQEMHAYGFQVLRLIPILTHFSLQSRMSYLLDNRCAFVSDILVRTLERMPSSQPLEWVALCQKAT